jgi:hypothetical protein
MDGSTFSTVESATLTQGVAFLYAQAGELLRHRRQKRDHAAATRESQDPENDNAVTAPSRAPGAQVLPPLRLPTEIFEPSGRTASEPRAETLDRLGSDLLQARRDVEEYVLGTAEFGGASENGLEAADRLRRILEEVYDAAVTFRGEHRAVGGDRTYVQARHVGVVGTSIQADYIAGRDIHIGRGDRD